MRRIIVLLTFTIFSNYIVAQQVYSTKSAEISFFSNTPLEDIEAKNNEVESKLSPKTGQVAFILLMKGFKFENQLMEDHFNEDYVESTKYPKAEFKGFITNITNINLLKDGSYPAKVKGNLTIHGITREVNTDGTIEVRGQRIAAKTKFNISLKDYNIGGTLIGKKIANNIEIAVDCQYE